MPKITVPLPMVIEFEKAKEFWISAEFEEVKESTTENSETKLKPSVFHGWDAKNNSKHSILDNESTSGSFNTPFPNLITPSSDTTNQNDDVGMDTASHLAAAAQTDQ